MTGPSPGRTAGGARLRVLVLSRNYPNDVLPLLGIWVDRMVRFATATLDMMVVAPVPYCPPLPFLSENYRRFRRVRRLRTEQGLTVYHPPFIVPAGSRLLALEGLGYLACIRRLVRRIRRNFPFDLIHAHFTYPDGWAAVRLGRQLGVPVIITEQAMWGPAMDAHPTVRSQAVWAARNCAYHIAISTALRASIVRYAGESSRLRVIPDGVDGSVFTLPPAGRPYLPSQILFVGNIRHVKGVDILLRAMPLVAVRRPDARLILIGESFYASYRAEYQRMKDLAAELGISDRVDFAGGKTDEEVVSFMQQSAVLVLPSRRESLGMVLAEALACGTPVVATRSGGPQDIVTPDVGILVPPEDPAALADGILQVLERRPGYQAEQLRAHALAGFGLESVHRRVAELYQAAVAGAGIATPRSG